MATMVLSFNAATNTTVTQTFSSADAQRYFQAWQNKAGPIDPATGKPNGTQQQMTAYASQAVIDAFNHLVTMNELQPVVPPATTPS
jgi:hypothetical protein